MDAEVLAGQVCPEGLWNLAVYGRGWKKASALDLLREGTPWFLKVFLKVVSESVPGSKLAMFSLFGSGGQREKSNWFWELFESKIVSSAHAL